MSRIKLITKEEAMQKIEKLLSSVTSKAWGSEPQNPQLIDAHNRVKYAARQYERELNQIKEILSFASDTPVRILSKKKAQKLKSDDLANECEGDFASMATVWQFPIEDPYILVVYKPIKDL